MGACFECGAPSAHDHHVIPRSRGGTKTVPLCEACHRCAHGLDYSGTDHRALTVAGIERARNKGVHIGRSGFMQEPSARATVERIRALRSSGASLREICATLAAEGRETLRGGRWQPGTVAKVLRRQEAA